MAGFEGKIVLVTGATSGIGRAASVLLAARGATVIAAGRRAAEGGRLEAEIAASGGRARYMPLDLAEPASIDRLFARIEAEYGRLDGAFNNAGTEANASLVSETPEAVFQAVFDINVRGTWLCLRHELRIMRGQGAGSIVNTSSLAGVMGFPRASVYTASKHAIVGMTKSAALDFPEQGIRVNCLCPGATRTEMAERWVAQIPGGFAAMDATIPMKRSGEPAELAEAAIWLLSDAASYVTGAVLVVDGGFSIG